MTKEDIELAVSTLNTLNQGYFNYVETVADYLIPELNGKQTLIRLRIYRDYPERKELFMQQHICDRVTEKVEDTVNMVRARLFSEILKHSIFGVKGVINL